MFLFVVNLLIWSALELKFFKLYFLQHVLGGHPVLSGHLAIPQGWPLYTGAAVLRFFSIHFTITGVKKIVCYTEDFIT